MISKRISKRTDGKFGYLADYLAAASDKGEKLDALWAVNCKSGEGLEDLDLIKAEIEGTQGRNTRARTDKTYHLLISFKTDKPSLEDLHKIEAEFAKVLGFEEHERLVATHSNTDNFHMHVAINKVHPETFLCHTPSHDYRARDRLCRELETRYALTVDKGIEQKQDGQKLHERAANFEAHSWEQSFLSYAREQKPKLDTAKDAAKNWKDLHAAFREHGLQLKASGAGLTICGLPKEGDEAGTGKASSHRIKASDLGREYSKTALEAKFGAYEPEQTSEVKAKQYYTRRPSLRMQRRYPNLSRQWMRHINSRSRRRVRTLRDYFMMLMIMSPETLMLLKIQNDMISLPFDFLRVLNRRRGYQHSTPIQMREEPPDITETFIKRMEVGTAPWSSEIMLKYLNQVQNQGQPVAYNPVSGKAFEGMNALWLAESGRTDPRWLTERQIKELGTSIKWGERPTYIEYWSFSTEQTAKDKDGHDVLDKEGNPVKRRAHLDQPKITRVAVYNGQQVRNRDKLPGLEGKDYQEKQSKAGKRFKKEVSIGNRRAKDIIAGSGIEIQRDRFSGSVYDPLTDTLHIRRIKEFRSLGAYHAETLHTLCEAVDSRLEEKRRDGPTDTAILNKLRHNIAAHMVCSEIGLKSPATEEARLVDKKALEALKSDERLFYTICREAETISRAVIDCEHRRGREFLLVPFKDAKVASEKGAKFDLIARSFYLPEDKEAKAFKPWLKEDGRIHLFVPQKDKGAVKKIGARWDGEKRSWYIPVFNTKGVREIRPNRFAKWFDNPKLRVPLKVPYTDSDEVKKLGARWEPETKTWHIKGFKGLDHTPFEKWLSKEPGHARQLNQPKRKHKKGRQRDGLEM